MTYEPEQVALGFREPPEQVTESCLTYMKRVMEARDFINFVFGFVKTSTQLGALIPKRAQEELGDRTFRVLTYNFSEHRQLVNELMLSRAVESFDLYLPTILRDIFLSRPEMLKSEQQIDVATVIDAGSYREVILKVVERKVHELGYQSLMNLRKYVTKATGIDFFEDDAAYEVALVASETRNLIAHNDCIVNALFEARTKGVTVDLDTSSRAKLLISDDWLRKTCYMLDSAVFRFDELAASKFKLMKYDRADLAKLSKLIDRLAGEGETK